MSKDRKAFSKKMTQQIFQEVWDEFYDWEEEYCKQALASLAPTSTPVTSLKNSQPSTNLCQTPKAVHVSRTKPGKESYEFITFSDGWQGPSIVQQCPPSYQCRTTEPFPPYEACTYSRKNLYFGDDCDVLPFMPFSDKPDFPGAEYLEHFGEIGWDDPKDPDRQSIACQPLWPSQLMLYF